MKARLRFAALTLVLTFLGAAVAVSPAAAGPLHFTFPIDETFSVDGCGFPVEGRTTGFIREHVFFDAEGNAVRVIDTFSLKITYTNLETGETLGTVAAGPDLITIHADNSATIASIGIVSKLVVEGQGVVAASIGRVVFFFTDPDDLDPDVLFVAGLHGGDFLSALCEALAS